MRARSGARWVWDLHVTAESADGSHVNVVYSEMGDEPDPTMVEMAKAEVGVLYRRTFKRDADQVSEELRRRSIRQGARHGRIR